MHAIPGIVVHDQRTAKYAPMLERRDLPGMRISDASMMRTRHEMMLISITWLQNFIILS